MDFSHIEYHERTDKGRKRKINEDSLVVCHEHGVYTVCDGMGGAEGGEIASDKAVKSIAEAFDALGSAREAPTRERKGKILDRAINKACRWIHDYAAERDILGMGTTTISIVFDAIHPDRGMVLHAGDSRCYRYRDGVLEQIMRDHSLAEAAGIKDEESMAPQFRGVVTRAVGIEESVELEKSPCDAREGDIFLLCSDGLSKMVKDERLEEIIREHETGSLSDMTEQLIAEANGNGGKDNITAVVVRVKAAEPRGDWINDYPEEDDTADTGLTPTADIDSAPTDTHDFATQTQGSTTTISGLTPGLGKPKFLMPAVAGGVALVVIIALAQLFRGGSSGDSGDGGNVTPPSVAEMQTTLDSRIKDAVDNGEWGAFTAFLEGSASVVDAYAAEAANTLPDWAAAWDPGSDVETKIELLLGSERMPVYRAWEALWQAATTSKDPPTSRVRDHRKRVIGILQGFAFEKAPAAPDGEQTPQQLANWYCRQRSRDDQSFTRAVAEFADTRRHLLAPLWEQAGTLDQLWLYARCGDSESLNGAKERAATLREKLAAVDAWQSRISARPLGASDGDMLPAEIEAIDRASEALFQTVVKRIGEMREQVEILKQFRLKAIHPHIDVLLTTKTLIEETRDARFDASSELGRSIGKTLGAVQAMHAALAELKPSADARQASLFLALNPADIDAIAGLGQAEDALFPESVDAFRSLPHLLAYADFLRERPRHGVIASRTRALESVIQARGEALVRTYLLPESLDLERARLVMENLTGLEVAWSSVIKEIESTRGHLHDLTPEAVQPKKEPAYAWGADITGDPWVAYGNALEALQRDVASSQAKDAGLPEAIDEKTYLAEWEEFTVPKTRLRVTVQGLKGPAWPSVEVVDLQPGVTVTLPGRKAAHDAAPNEIASKWGETLHYDVSRAKRRKENREVALDPPNGLARLCRLAEIAWSDAAMIREKWWPYLTRKYQNEFDLILRQRALTESGPALRDRKHPLRRVDTRLELAGLECSKILKLLEAWDNLSILEPDGDAFEVIPDILRLKLQKGSDPGTAINAAKLQWPLAKELHGNLATAMEADSLKALEQALRLLARNDLSDVIGTGKDIRRLLETETFENTWSGFGEINSVRPMAERAAAVRALPMIVTAQVPLSGRGPKRPRMSYTLAVERPVILARIGELWKQVGFLSDDAKPLVERAAWAVIEKKLVHRLDSSLNLMQGELREATASRARLGQDCLLLADGVDAITARVAQAPQDSAVRRRLIAIFDKEHYAEGIMPADAGAIRKKFPWLAAAADAIKKEDPNTP